MLTIPESWRNVGAVEPLDWLSRPSRTQVLAIVGGRDTMTPTADVDRLRALGDRVDIAFYPDAEHGFVHDPSRATHRPDDAADAWARAIAFLS
jgi:carboxymethylenebutenolidase